jgi:pimeloyl-ACP methyl ester carboxylesterase
VSQRGFFWVGVERQELDGGTVPRGPMYVEWERPAHVEEERSIVLVHGGGGQGLDWLGTPDGRPGWASLLVERGFTVYVVDRPGHGRAAFHPDILGPMGQPFTFELASGLFTRSAGSPFDHPTSHLHTQWPGDGGPGDPMLAGFVAGSGPMLKDVATAHELERARMAELLDRIGPAVVFTHSAGGPAGWLAADARPALVQALVAIEPLGPPFAVNPSTGWSLEWGLTQAPLAFDPPCAAPADLRPTPQGDGEVGGPGLVLQGEPARRLVNLSRIPIAVVSAEASVFAHSDPHTVAFLRQAGCRVEHVCLADHGVHGNGHLMMLERNSVAVLAVILDRLPPS